MIFLKVLEDLERLHTLLSGNKNLKVHRRKGEHCINIQPTGDKEIIQVVMQEIDAHYFNLRYKCHDGVLRVCPVTYSTVLSDTIKKYVGEEA